MLLSIPVFQATEQSYGQFDQEIISDQGLQDSLFTVFAEYATTSWCPNCPTASAALKEVKQSTEQSFQYITLVSDLNDIARERSRIGFFNVAIPSVYVDGGYRQQIGGSQTVPATADIYRDLIAESASRNSRYSLSVQTEVEWLGDAELEISISVTNDEPSFYIGIVRSYITEIVSRWNDFSGEPYGYTMLDYAIKKPIFLRPDETKTFVQRWDGKEDHSGLTFADITQDNIMVQTAVYHWKPTLKSGYQSDTYNQRYLAFYVDQSDHAVPTE